MGFVNYHGPKKDQYSEAVSYAKIQQEQQTQETAEEDVRHWLKKLNQNSSLLDLRPEELLKLIVGRYKKETNLYIEITRSSAPGQLDNDRLWKDFSIDFVGRSLQSFRIDQSVRERTLQTFINRIFKITDCVDANDHFEYLKSNKRYKTYFTECFDPTWKGRQFYKYLRNECNASVGKLDDFYGKLAELKLTIDVLLFYMLNPKDAEWTKGEEEEITALLEIRDQKSTLGLLRKNLLQNPLYKVVDTNGDSEETKEIPEAFTRVEQPSVKSKLDKRKFKELIEKENITGFIEASRMLIQCDLPEDIEKNYKELIERMPVLEEAVNKFDDIYHADLETFYTYYAPETLSVTATFLNYLAGKPSEKILSDLKENVFLASKKLLQVVNDKIDEIYKFVTIEANAEARAVESVMSQNGHVDDAFNINGGRK